jgi:aminoglycoside 6-adenylyltransferase
VIVAHDPQDVVRRLVEWANQRDAVCALLLTSTRANPHAPVDIFSDYDVVLVVEDIRPFFEDRTWLQDFGQVLVVYWDPIEPDSEYGSASENGIEQTGNVTYYADGLHIDFKLWPVTLAQRIAQTPALPARLDDGYAVLVDKDHLLTGLRPPTYRTYIPARPGEETFQTMIQDFFSDAPYVAKCLWRDELLPAKQCLDYDMKYVYLLPMLEWRMERDHGWSVATGNMGKGLKKLLPSEIWSELEGTCAGADIAENWEALFRTMALFRRVAIDVAADLGYTYPLDLDRRVTAYVQAMRNQGHDSQ